MIRTNYLSVINPSVPPERGLLHIFASERPATVSTNNSSELNNLSIFSFDLYFESVKRFMFSVVRLNFCALVWGTAWHSGSVLDLHPAVPGSNVAAGKITPRGVK